MNLVEFHFFVQIQRRLLYDDGKGVGEPLNETGQFGDGIMVRGKHWLLLDTVESSARQHRLLAESIFMDPLVAFQDVTTAPNVIPPVSAVTSIMY